MSDKARTVSERAVRKASRERLLRDFARAARIVHYVSENPPDEWPDCECCSGAHPRDFYGDCRDDENRWPSRKAVRAYVRDRAQSETSRTRYACLMTAFGQ